MITAEFGYLAPHTVKDAVAALQQGGARALSGGQGLLTSIKLGRAEPTLLVDLGRIPELSGIEVRPDGALRIGAAATLTELAQALDEVPGTGTALRAAATAIDDIQIRNRATVGGTLADRSSASDLAAALLVLDGRAHVEGPSGRRVVSLTDFYTPAGPLIAEADIIVAVEVPAPVRGLRSAYERMTDRATLSPVAGVAVALAGSQVTVAVTGATPWPRRLIEGLIEGFTVGDVGSEEQFLDDDVASAAYRAHLTRVLAGRAFARLGAGRA